MTSISFGSVMSDASGVAVIPGHAGRTSLRITGPAAGGSAFVVTDTDAGAAAVQGLTYYSGLTSYHTGKCAAGSLNRPVYVGGVGSGIQVHYIEEWE